MNFFFIIQIFFQLKLNIKGVGCLLCLRKLSTVGKVGLLRGSPLDVHVHTDIMKLMIHQAEQSGHNLAHIQGLKLESGMLCLNDGIV